MACKRIIGVLAVRDGRLVKSYGYASWRPAGGLVTALQNLDRWAADEIVVLDISRRAGLDPAVLKQIAAARISTPLAYGGGIRDERDIARLMDLGCDRFVVEHLLFDNAAVLDRLGDLAGRQALIGSLPVRLQNGDLHVWRPARRGGGPGFEPLALWREHVLSSVVSEYFVTAVDAEGCAGRFPLPITRLLEWLPPESVIWFGGLDAPLATECLRCPHTAAVAFGNPLHETELALPKLRRSVLAATEDASLRLVRSFAS